MYDYGRRPQDLNIIETIINTKYPEYLDAYQNVMDGKSAHYRNMLITKKEIFDDYCAWLFGILFSLEEELCRRGENIKNSRRYGFISEIMLDVYLMQNCIRYFEVPIITTDISLKQRLSILFNQLINSILEKWDITRKGIQ